MAAPVSASVSCWPSGASGWAGRRSRCRRWPAITSRASGRSVSSGSELSGGDGAAWGVGRPASRRRSSALTGACSAAITRTRSPAAARRRRRCVMRPRGRGSCIAPIPDSRAAGFSVGLDGCCLCCPFASRLAPTLILCIDPMWERACSRMGRFGVTVSQQPEDSTSPAPAETTVPARPSVVRQRLQRHLAERRGLQALARLHRSSAALRSSACPCRKYPPSAASVSASVQRVGGLCATVRASTMTSFSTCGVCLSLRKRAAQ